MTPPLETLSSTPQAVEAADASGEFAALVPHDFARDRLVISDGINDEGREVLVVSGRDEDDLVAHNLAARLGREVTLRLAPAESIASALDALAARRTDARASTERAEDHVAHEAGGISERDIAAALAAEDRDLLRTAGRAPIVRLVNALLFEALSLGASDVHIQPAPAPGTTAPGTTAPAPGTTAPAPGTTAPAPGTTARGSTRSRPVGEQVVVRFRVDGALFDAHALPRKLLEPVVSRVKVMAKMDVAERRLPQDGRAGVTIAGQEIDLRVSTLPTALGERVVVRLLDKRRVESFDLDRLGMPEDVRGLFEGLCERPHGMVLVAGPTGSGKTTTLYGVLRRFASPELNVLTLEDPIEYELPGVGVSQSQVNLKKGVTFASGLRHLLRQDPDVIMVGEIRDAETARIAIQAALTGHLVLSTIHTNSAAGAIARLLDLGVEPFLINAALTAVLAQRLVRTVCPTCRGGACTTCRGTGMKGRTGLYELLVLTPSIKDRIARGASASEIEEAARRAGMRSLRESGLAAVAAGRTTRLEVDRVIAVDDADADAPMAASAVVVPGLGALPGVGLPGAGVGGAS